MKLFDRTPASAAVAFLCFAMACGAGSSPASAAGPISPDDRYNMADIADPVFAPGGTGIAYSLSTNDRKKDESYSDLWTVPWAGGPARQLTKTPEASESQPGYSRDGKWLAFMSDAKVVTTGKGGKAEEPEEDTQLWLMPAGGGEPRRVTSLPEGISDYSLSPDGRRAVVVAETGSRVGTKADNPPPIVIDRFYFKEDGRGYLDDRTQQLFVVDLQTGEARQITTGKRDHWQPAWSPDGKWIAYTAKDHGDADRTFDSNVFVIAPEGGEPRRISPTAHADNDPSWSPRPAWSPDSRRLVWLEGGEDKWIYYAPHQLAVADVVTGEVTRPARIDRWFYKPRWSEDGQSILALVEQDRDTWLARVDPASGDVAYLTKGKRFATDFAVGDGGHIAVLDGDSHSLPELRAVGGSLRPLTRHNEWIAGRGLGEVRDVAFTREGSEIHGIVTLPPGYRGGRLPLLVRLHGGPVYQFSHEFDLDTQIYAASGYAVLQVNPRGSSGRGFDFARAIYADWGNVDARDISAGIDHVIASGIADPERIGVGGWSYGGILTNYMIASDPRIKAAVSGAGASNFFGTYGVDMYAREYDQELGPPWQNFETWRKLAYPFLEPQRIKAATLFQCAEEDDNVPCPGAEQMYLALKTLGVPTGLVVYPGENHGLTVPSYLVDRVRRNIAWYDRWLKAPTAVSEAQ